MGIGVVKPATSRALFAIVAAFFVGVSATISYNIISLQPKVDEPIVSNMRVVDMRASNGKAYIHVYGTAGKRCGPPLAIEGSSNGIQIKVRFLDDANPDGSFRVPDQQPKGDRDFGVWELDPAPTDRFVDVWVFHDCGDEGIVKTEWTFDLERLSPVQQRKAG